MKEDELDMLLENYLAEMPNNPSKEWLQTNANNLFRQGIGLDGLLRLVKEEHGQEIFEQVETALSQSNDGLIQEAGPSSGVGGLLLLLCFVLVAFTPARNIYSAYILYESTSPLFMDYEGIKHLTYMSLLLISAISLFSVYCGISLWQLKQNAVKITKIYLIGFLLVNLIQPVLLYVFDLPSEVVDASLQGFPKEYIQPLVFFVFWYSYLSISKRVADTYRLDAGSESPVQ